MRIREVQKYTDPTDPDADPEHCLHIFIDFSLIDISEILRSSTFRFRPEPLDLNSHRNGSRIAIEK